MKIEGSYTFKASRKRVWDLLLDPKIMAQCMPGCDGLEEVGPDQYEATMKIGIAAVKGTYKGKVSIKEKQAPVHYVLSGEGSGGPGFIQGEMAIDLDEKDGETILRYSADAKVGGLIAGVGQRMIGGIAKVTVEQFFKKVESFI
ncbi:carbon monoxide dehydrogenase subunit G [candidate division TA06 bacterium]|nr:carbon monoxide dehydrogenase subunit G [candidate division TA06 bacterium]MCH8056135.1 carbon monoxide dehydrogenase subunit G [Deltaproteobacteria bacterium]